MGQQLDLVIGVEGKWTEGNMRLVVWEIGRPNMVKGFFLGMGLAIRFQDMWYFEFGLKRWDWIYDFGWAEWIFEIVRLGQAWA